MTHPAAPSSVSGRRRRWTAGTWSTGAPDADGAWIVESFLVDSGRVRCPEAHLRRFIRSCADAELSVDAAAIHRFWVDAQAATPATGRWFPRLEAHRGSPAPLVHWLRPAPALTPTVRLWFPGRPDARRYPRLKGPDLAPLAALRQEAVQAGFDDAVLVDARGRVLEAAHSALLWWRGDTLGFPAAHLPTLPSITSAQVLRAARALGVGTRAETLRLDDVEGLELWAVNALHGIRPVTAWGGATGDRPAPPFAPQRLARFRAAIPAAVPYAGPFGTAPGEGEACAPS